jgi:hypothetical protein
MRFFNFALGVVLIALLASSLSAQTTVNMTVTTSSSAIQTSSSGYFAVLYEQSSTPSAAFTVTTMQSNGTLSTVSVSVGAAYVFSRQSGSPFQSGELLGWIEATTPGPYSFVLVQYANAPNAPVVSAVKCPTGQSVNQINPDGTTICLPQTPAGQSSIVQWNSTLNALTFTAPAGTWSSPVWFTNASPVAQQNQAGTEFSENTDGQFEIVTHSNGQTQALLNLDTDGHISLYGANGGGIATDRVGNTCLASANGACWNVVFANNGPLVNYQGVALKSGHGMPVILFGGGANLSGNFGPYALYTTPGTGYTSTGLFRVSGYVVATSAALNATLQVKIDYTDISGANAQDSGSPISFGAVGAKLPFSFMLQAIPGTPINLTVNTTNVPVYTIDVDLEAL